MTNADFHLHTRFSKCSDMDPKGLVKKAISENLDVVGVVDHGSIKGGLAAKKSAGKKILVIPGEEIKTEFGDLVVFLSDGKYGGNILEICERARRENAFVFVPHPFDALRHSIGRNIGKVRKYADAIEVFNSRCMMPGANERAEKFAEENSLPGIGGSDAHFLGEVGNVSCKMDCERNIDSVLECVRKGKIRISGRKSPFMMHAKTHLVKLSRKLSTLSLSESTI